MSTKRITNTTKLVEEDPLLALAEMMTLGSDKAIEVQEARGQRELVHAAQLPVEGCDEAALTALGFVLGPPNAGDPLFRPATFPAGWRLQATDHAMWSDLLDDKGRKRGAVFYKAAFYDRRANMYLSCRYKVDRYALVDAVVVLDTAAGAVIKSFPFKHAADEHDRDAMREEYEAKDAAAALAMAWLDEHYPDNAHPSAYWDEAQP